MFDVLLLEEALLSRVRSIARIYKERMKNIWENTGLFTQSNIRFPLDSCLQCMLTGIILMHATVFQMCPTGRFLDEARLQVNNWKVRGKSLCLITGEITALRQTYRNKRSEFIVVLFQCEFVDGFHFRSKIKLQKGLYAVIALWNFSKKNPPWNHNSNSSDKQTIPELYFHPKLFCCFQKVGSVFSQLNPLFSSAV